MEVHLLLLLLHMVHTPLVTEMDIPLMALVMATSVISLTLMENQIILLSVTRKSLEGHHDKKWLMLPLSINKLTLE